MDLQEVFGIGALVGIGLVAIGTLLLALLPHWGGFRLQRTPDEPEPGALEQLVTAFVEALTGFLKIVVEMVTSGPDRPSRHPGQVMIAVGMLLFLLCALVLLIAQLA
jgi:uncharacterized protein YjeT (DUF2065 family)